MQDVIQDFVVWFGRFVFCSTVILLVGHAAARKIRRRKTKRSDAGEQAGRSPAPVRGMQKLMNRNRSSEQRNLKECGT